MDRVLEILRTTELYSPQLGTKDEDPHTSDLVGGLMTVSDENKPEVNVLQTTCSMYSTYTCCMDKLESTCITISVGDISQGILHLSLHRSFAKLTNHSRGDRPSEFLLHKGDPRQLADRHGPCLSSLDLAQYSGEVMASLLGSRLFM